MVGAWRLAGVVPVAIFSQGPSDEYDWLHVSAESIHGMD